jgi:GDP-4-dehydro-6-deoxy-D-mannose reductase
MKGERKADVVLVTGASGFVGGHLLSTLGSSGVGPDVDVTDESRVVAVVRYAAPRAIVHLAALSSVAESWTEAGETWRVNVLGTVNLLAAVKAEVPRARVLAVSSGEVYGRAESTPMAEDAPVAPLSPYAASKAAAEIACAQAARGDGLDVVVARAFPHVGPGQDERFAIGAWTMGIARLEAEGGGTLRVGNLDVRRDLTDVRDVCNAYRLLLDPDVPAGVYNVASGTAVCLRDVLDVLLALAEVEVEVAIDPDLVRPVDAPSLVGDPSRLEQATGWRPTIPLDRSLADALEHARTLVKTGKNEQRWLGRPER